MQPLRFYLATCLSEKLLTESPIDGVYWSSAIPAKLAQASRAGNRFVTLGLGDFLVSSYSRMKTAKRAIDALSPGCWAGTEIHHVVENFHLQFLGVKQTISDATYENSEPCVLMAKKHHDTHINGIIGDAEDIVMSVRPFNFVEVFKTQHPGISKLALTQQAAMRANWVKQQEVRKPPTLRREQVRDCLRELYAFAYQLPELRPLKLIARSVIDSMPL